MHKVERQSVIKRQLLLVVVAMSPNGPIKSLLKAPRYGPRSEKHETAFLIKEGGM